MKTKKLLSLLSLMLVLGSLVFAGSVSANEDRMGEDRGNSEQATEAHVTGSKLEVHILNNGRVNVRGAKVTSIAGNTINASTAWGSVNMAWAVNSLSTTHIVRKAGGVSSIAEVSVGDFISFEGNLVSTSASPIIVNAASIKNWSVQKKTHTNLTGMIKSIDATGMKFVLSRENNTDLTVMTSALTTFKKGSEVAVFNDITVGSKVKVEGIYDSQLLQVTAEAVKIYVPEVARTITEGTIKSIAATSMVVTAGDKDYTVNLTSGTSVLNASWLKRELTAFHVGDQIRVYGSVNMTTLTIDATVVRDTTLAV
ncbi:hypothetical protein BH09PAT1_BH09PAT1_8360 [soil metagenome]